MKKLFAVVILAIMSLPSVGAEYKLDGSENNVHTQGMVKTTSIEMENTSVKKMHPSWDKNEDGINDCENDGTCDHTVDYTLPKKMHPSWDRDNDGINDCENDGTCDHTIDYTLPKKMHPSWDKNEDGINDCENDGTCDHTVDYTLPKKIEEPKICTMEYAPVCAQVEIQCVTTPCNPVEQTFSNSCSAGENKILYSGECNSLVDAELLLSYNKHNETISQRFENLSNTTLELMISDLDARISAVKNSRIAQFVQIHRITQYTYVKQRVMVELSMR